MTDELTPMIGKPTQAELDAFEEECRQGVLKYVRQKETEWKQHGLCYAWIDPEPAWAPAGQSSWYYDYDPVSKEFGFPYPKTPCRRILRFSLLGGGQIRVIETWKESDIDVNHDRTWRAAVGLRVTAHLPDGLIRTFGGVFHHGWYSEMDMAGVAFPLMAGQTIADRVAATFRLIDGIKENFYALLDGAEGCAICGKALRDEISKLCGVGPDCARQYRIAHTREAAEGRLALRRKLLAI